MSNYYNKYLKYKNKYLELKGGVGEDSPIVCSKYLKVFHQLEVFYNQIILKLNDKAHIKNCKR